MRRVAVLLATAFGVGHIPTAPGTAASAVAVWIFLATRDWPFLSQAALVAAISLVGIWAAGEAARHFGRDDPGQVVIDEVAGQLVSLLATGVAWRGALLGFFIFRALDIVKPPPVDRLERLPGGAGIMADDLMAGLYANLILRTVERLLPSWGW